ncbi:MAG: hypothetical protein FWG90_00210 [Oscillospiraceae bacterium]|nr:hypothetical protein [Oscillospiraceae bacterium]
MSSIFQCSLDVKGNSVKPDSSTAGQISNRIGKNIQSVSQDNIKQFVQMVGKEGYTFCPATFNEGERNKANFNQQQLFALDFDGGVTFEEVKDRSERYNLPMLFAYETLIGENGNKFRAVFLNDAPISDRKVTEAILKSFETMFPEADKSCIKDTAKMYYGGKRLIHFDESMPEIAVDLLFMNMSLYLKDKYGATNYKRKLREFSKATGIRLNHKDQPDVTVSYGNPPEVLVNDKSSPNSTTIISKNGKSLLKYYQINLDDSTNIKGVNLKPKTTNAHLPYRSNVLGEVKSNCRLFREFEAGDRQLHHDELFGLATNIIQIESGARCFNDYLYNNSYFGDRKHKYESWDYYLKYIKDYKPQSCDRFCPYKDTCSHGTNILSSSRLKYHEFERLSNFKETYVSIKEAEDDFAKELYKAIKSKRTGWHIIKAQTSLGKTEKYIEALKDLQGNVLVAVPTNKLKNEIVGRFSKMGVDVIMSPFLHEIKDIIPDYIWSTSEKDYAAGKSVIPYLLKLIENSHPDADLFVQYLNELESL